VDIAWTPDVEIETQQIRARLNRLSRIIKVGYAANLDFHQLRVILAR